MFFDVNLRFEDVYTPLNNYITRQFQIPINNLGSGAAKVISRIRDIFMRGATFSMRGEKYPLPQANPFRI